MVDKCGFLTDLATHAATPMSSSPFRWQHPGNPLPAEVEQPPKLMNLSQFVRRVN